MSPAAFIDANVPIYAAGREHPYKAPCARVLMLAAEHPQSFVTDAEVLQELVHRYVASGRWTLGREVLFSFAEVMHDRIEPVYAKDILEAAELADPSPRHQRPRPPPRRRHAARGRHGNRLRGLQFRPPAGHHPSGPDARRRLGRIPTSPTASESVR